MRARLPPPIYVLKDANSCAPAGKPPLTLVSEPVPVLIIMPAVGSAIGLSTPIAQRRECQQAGFWKLAAQPGTIAGGKPERRQPQCHGARTVNRPQFAGSLEIA
ncbi:hypothetical protein FRZ44_20500 [Hypericibacter terrae]|uniref:Uncharacterized protein n=1 Tax=Hypericibacter terrae TaxID=2602015 RepID=A0A5J6MJV1_9PROT|nr:hypothetical protein FRZ44_20500 [Hypericibacter terrae]